MNRTILHQERNRVKGLLALCGVKHKSLAARARYSRQTISDYIAGRNRCIDGQFRILRAFNGLVGEGYTMREFWGRLAPREVA